MGSINLIVPGDMKLEYKIDNRSTVDQIIQIIKNTTLKKKTNKKPTENNDIVGIWKNNFDENLSSEVIRENFREKTWRRY